MDLLHTPNVLPSIKKDSKSNFSRILFVLFLIACIVVVIYRLIYWDNNYTINYTQDFQKTIGKINKKVTFGFKIRDNVNSYELEYFDSLNEKIDNNLIKRCDSNLKEIKDNETNDDDFFCFINYPIIGSNMTNHILKLHIKAKDKKSLKSERIPLIVKFIEPTIKHKDDNPFDYSELYEMIYFYNLESASSYRKYIKIINYKSKGFFKTSNYDSAYLEDYEDLSKMNALEDDNMIGSFRFSLSKKKDIFERKYLNWCDFPLDIISNLISIMGIFSFISLIFINPNDNLRIFYTLKQKKPSLFQPTSKLINDFYHKKNRDIPTNDELNIPDKIECKDKLKYFFSYYFCCDCCKKRELKAIDDFINEKLIINDTFENLIIEEIKYKFLEKKIDRIASNGIPPENRNSNNSIYNYLEPTLHDEFPNYEAEEIRIKIREIIDEKFKFPLPPVTT